MNNSWRLHVCNSGCNASALILIPILIWLAIEVFFFLVQKYSFLCSRLCFGKYNIKFKPVAKAAAIASMPGKRRPAIYATPRIVHELLYEFLWNMLLDFIHSTLTNDYHGIRGHNNSDGVTECWMECDFARHNRRKYYESLQKRRENIKMFYKL